MGSPVISECSSRRGQIQRFDQIDFDSTGIEAALSPLRAQHYFTMKGLDACP